MEIGFCSLAVAVLLSTTVLGQNIEYRANVHHGVFLNHSPKSNVGGISLGQITVYELGIERTPCKNKCWHKALKLANWGVLANFYDLTPTVLPGHGLSFLIYQNVPLLRVKDNVSWTLSIGTGLGYFTNRYNSENTKNLWISALINPSLYFRTEFKFKITPHAYLLMGGAYHHYSNGATSMPNLGVNYATVFTGLAIAMKKNRTILPDIIADSIPKPTEKRSFIHVSYAFGFKQLPEFGSTTYLTHQLGVQYAYRFTNLSKVLIGMDGFYDNSLKDSTWETKKDPIPRLGAFLGYEVLLDKLAFSAGLGYYLYKKTERDAPIYFRIGLKYYATQRVFFGILLKTHYGQADCIEWTTGLRF